MPYKLLLSEEIGPAIRRIALEQVSRARRELSASRNMQEGVHQARKCMKRVRSLLRLARPLLGEAFYRQHNLIYRDVGRALSRPRQAGALLETVLRFEASPEFNSHAPLLEALKGQLLSDKYVVETELEMVALTALIETLDQTCESWKALRVSDAGFHDLASGFGMSYSRGRKSLQKAIHHQGSFYLHEWRKDVQQCWRQMQILTLLWPEDIMPRIRLAQEIARLLGTEHDLSELTAYLKAHQKEISQLLLQNEPGMKKKEIKQMRKRFTALAGSIQNELCLHAVARGRRLYAIEPKALEQAMTIYWRTGKALQPMPSVVRLLADLKDGAGAP